ncbi:MAG TPA: tetratricopeptide repeat protein [Polyangiaceae bacterium]|nr:tetratricopeptide repeat protein [Polyangiaceae bacterium]
MADDVNELLAGLAAEAAPTRERELERERRRRVVQAMNERLAARSGTSSRGSFSRWWLVLPAAAAVALAVGAMQRSSQPSALELEPERLRPIHQPEAPKAIESPPQDQPALAPPNVASGVRPAPSSPLKVAPPPSASAEPAPVAPSLAAQNELFQSAVRAERRGDDAAALAALDQLLTRYPGSVLAADARVRKFRTLTRLGRAGEAKAAAEDYVTKHPEGFAATEAGKLLEPEKEAPSTP